MSQSAPAAPAAKAKHVSKKEPVLTEPEVEVTSWLDDVQADVVLPKSQKLSVKSFALTAGSKCPLRH